MGRPGENAGRIRTNGEKRRVAEIEQTRIPHDDIEPQSQNHKHRRIGDGVEELQVEEQINYREKEQGGHAQTPGQPLLAAQRQGWSTRPH